MANADSTRGGPAGAHARNNPTQTHPRGKRRREALSTERAQAHPANLHEALDHLGTAISAVEVVYHALEAIQSRVGLMVEDDNLTIGAEVLGLRCGVTALRRAHEELDLMISDEQGHSRQRSAAGSGIRERLPP
jgi:hypothetical protein